MLNTIVTDQIRELEPVMTLTCRDIVEYVRKREGQKETERIVDLIEAAIKRFVNKRRNIFSALKIDAQDRQSI